MIAWWIVIHHIIIVILQGRFFSCRPSERDTRKSSRSGKERKPPCLVLLEYLSSPTSTSLYLILFISTSIPILNQCSDPPPHTGHHLQQSTDIGVIYEMFEDPSTLKNSCMGRYLSKHISKDTHPLLFSIMF